MPRLVSLLLLVLVLSACASGPPKRIYPPQARIQELAVLANGDITMKLRLQNFSNVPMRFSRLSAALEMQGQPAGALEVALDLSVGPGSAEIVEHRASLDAGARARIQDSLDQRRALRYQLKGEILSQEPRDEFEFDYQSTLDPVPGLNGVLR